MIILDKNEFIPIDIPDRSKLSAAEGQGVFNYKHFIYFCGGEISIGRETWLKNVCAYDTMKETSTVVSQ